MPKISLCGTSIKKGMKNREKNKISIQSKIEYFAGMLDNYGKPMFKSRFSLIRHCINLTAKEEPVSPEEIRKRREFQNTGQKMEEGFLIGSELLLLMGTEKAPLFPEVLKQFNYYKQFLKEQ